MVPPCLSPAFRCDGDSYLAVSFLDGHVEHLNGPREIRFNRWQHEHIRVVPHQRYIATEKQCIDVVYRDGRFERRFGPCQVTFDPFEHKSCKAQELRRHVASQGEYLIVQYKDGRMDHIHGPHELNFHPLEHERIEVHEALKLAANEAIVVYRRQPASGQLVLESAPSLLAKTKLLPPSKASARHPAAAAGKALSGAEVNGAGAVNGAPVPLLTTEVSGQEGAMHVERRVVHGPAVFIPDSNEWLHTFSWHGSKNAEGKGSKTGYQGDFKIPHALNFQVLRCMPDSMYLSVRDVRTVDDANITVHLMLFYELKSIETMLDSTNDMIGDFVNAAAADVMTFASRLTYETFLQETAELSRTANFPILAARMEQTGNALLKVVYRGYGAAAALQEMHDQAIARRTKLRLESDAAREEQEKRAMELRCRRERSVQEQDLEAAAAKHKLQVHALQKEQERKLQDEEHAASLRHAQERSQMELADERARHDELIRREKEIAELQARTMSGEREGEVKKCEALKELGVDLTAYLCALATVKPDQHIRVDAGGAAPPAVHLELPRKR